MQHEHGDIVILFISGQHPVNQVFQKAVGMPDHLRRCLAGDGEQLIQAGIETAGAVLN
jgi:hypothetical protein